MTFARRLLALATLVGSGWTWFAFLAAPNMAHVRESGLGWMLHRAAEQPLDAVVFVGAPLLAFGQLAAAFGLATNRGGRWLLWLSASFLVLVGLGAVGLLVLEAAARGAGGGH